MLRYYSAGESHGKTIVGFLEGLPHGLRIDEDLVNAELKLRQSGYGRGGRMKIETDRVEILSGVKGGRTLGSPIAFQIINKDNSIERLHPLLNPRPGHADLAGALKFHTHDGRDILERASARETCARVAAGALCKTFLAEFEMDILAYVLAIGMTEAKTNPSLLTGKALSTARTKRNKSSLHMLDSDAEKKALAQIKKAGTSGETLGGLIQITSLGIPAGLGSHSQWDLRLDGRLAQALLSIPAMKAIEFGDGISVAQGFGSQAHDNIYFQKGAYPKSAGFYRRTNHAGGIEGGISNGMPITAKVSMKPISTLRDPIRAKTVNLKSKRDEKSTRERGDVTSVPAAAIVAENVSAFIIAQSFLEKFSGDSMKETARNYKAYLKYLSREF